MVLESQIVIVSAFGRGQWLAVELARQGLDVALVDVSHQLGRWTPEDWEGPFGVFRSERFTSSQKERMLADETQVSVDNGLTVLLGDGPIEMQGPLTKYQLEKRQFAEQARSYLFDFDSISRDEQKKRQQELLNLDFKQTWHAQLAHQLTSNVYVPNPRSILYGRPLNIFKSFAVRQATFRGLDKSLEWCRQEKVKVYDQTDILDVSMQSYFVDGIEISGQRSGLLKGMMFVWMLSSEESQRFSPRVHSKLFPGGSITSEWYWSRYRMRFDAANIVTEMLPLHMVIIKDIHLPWTHTGMCVLQRTVKQNEFDVWLRVPTNQRFKKAYIEQTAQQLTKHLSEVLVSSNPEISDLPQEYHYTYEELGAPRYPVFDLQQLVGLRRAPLRNIHFDGPETWDLLTWDGQFYRAGQVLEAIVKWNKNRKIKKDVEA